MAYYAVECGFVENELERVLFKHGDLFGNVNFYVVHLLECLVSEPHLIDQCRREVHVRDKVITTLVELGT